MAYLPKGAKVKGGYSTGYRRLTDEEYQRDLSEWLPPIREGVLYTHGDDRQGWRLEYIGTMSKYYHTYKCTAEGCEAGETRLCNRFSKREEECKCDIT